MAKKKSEPYIPHLYRRTIKVKNKKRKDCLREKPIYYYWWIDEDGIRHYGSTGCSLKADAEIVIGEIIRNNELGKKKDDLTLAEFAEPFFVEGKCPILKAKVARKKDYSTDFAKWTHNQVDHHVVKHLGHYPLVNLTPFIIQNWLNNLPETDKLRNNSCNKQFQYLKQILDVAVLQGILKRNPCNMVVRLESDTQIRPAFTESEIKKLFETPWEDEFSYVACLTAGDAATRISEIRGLKPSDIKEDTLEISHSYSRSGERPTKNGRTARVPISPVVREWLLKLAEGRRDDEYIFSL